MKLSIRAMAVALAVCADAGTASAQTVPFIDTEDATLSQIEVGAGDVHPVLSVDVRNGDYARGAYDDDDAGFDRVPFHVAIGGVAVLHRRADGKATLFLVGQSSNGVHAPRPRERVRPRAWYESNSIVGLAARPADGLTAAIAYAVKTSPNGVAATTHETSLTFLYDGDDAWGALSPRAAVTTRTKGDGGVYTILGLAPEFDLTGNGNGPTLTVPLNAGVGWGGFYAAGSGNRAYGSVGVAVAQPVRIGGARASLQMEILALARDGGLRRLDAPHGTTAAIVPLATLSMTMAW